MAPLEGYLPPVITNITSGIVIERNYVLARLVNINPENPSPDITIETGNGRSLKAEFIGLDDSTGFSVLHVPDLNIDPPKFAQQITLSDGELLHILSPSFAQERQIKVSQRGSIAFPTIRLNESRGRVLQAQRTGASQTKRDTFVIKAPVGVSRNPAVSKVIQNERGEVIGVTMDSIKADARTVNYIVYPINKAQSTARQIIELRKNTSRGWLGATGMSLSEFPVEERALLNLPNSGEGVIVTSIIPSSPADLAGLQKNDLLVRFGESEVKGLTHLREMISSIPVGQNVELEVIRQGQLRKLSAVVDRNRMPTILSSAEMEGAAGSPKVLELQRLLRVLRNQLELVHHKNAQLQEETVQALQAKILETEASLAAAFQQASRARLESSSGYLTLGISVRGLTPQLAHYFGVPEGRGALVVSINRNSLAERAGIRAGDIIVAINDRTIMDGTELEQLSLLIKPADTIKLTVYRDKKQQALEAKLK